VTNVTRTNWITAAIVLDACRNLIVGRHLEKESGYVDGLTVMYFPILGSAELFRRPAKLEQNSLGGECRNAAMDPTVLLAKVKKKLDL
jgi:hypothetical protein